MTRIAKIVQQQSAAADSKPADQTAGYWAVDPHGNLVLQRPDFRESDLKPGWRWATQADLDRPAPTEAEVQARAGRVGGVYADPVPTRRSAKSE